MLALRDKVAAFSGDLKRFTHELSDGLEELQETNRSQSGVARKLGTQ